MFIIINKIYISNNNKHNIYKYNVIFVQMCVCFVYVCAYVPKVSLWCHSSGPVYLLF